ncbi:BAR adaptor protein Hob1, partial [Dimargaris verticillata]
MPTAPSDPAPPPPQYHEAMGSPPAAVTTTTPGAMPTAAVVAGTMPASLPVEETTQPRYAIALYDFVAQEDGDLSFKADDKIEILEKSNTTHDWWKGKCQDRVGIFP